jgi:leucyl-tRNA synthetase
MRKQPTKAEACLWEQLKGKRLDVRFIRQHPIFGGRFIADFAAPSVSLIIEVDGEYHNDRQVEDSNRTRIIENSRLYKVMRFTNDQILKHTNEVMMEISNWIIKHKGEEGSLKD